CARPSRRNGACRASRMSRRDSANTRRRSSSPSFGIRKDGALAFVNVLKSSGFQIYDDYAVNAVKQAAPFPPIPDTLSAKNVPIRATFRYVVESSLEKILKQGDNP